MTEVLGDARIVPDERSNSLIVYANRADMVMITNIVSKVDVLLAQVLGKEMLLTGNGAVLVSCSHWSHHIHSSQLP